MFRSSKPVKTASRGIDRLDRCCNAEVGPSHEITFPDGGLRAWLVVWGAFCAEMATYGFLGSWGVFQAYYERTLLHDRTPSDIAWIGSLQYSLAIFPSVFIGRLFDLGYFQIPFLIGSVALALATIVIAECKEYWQFLLVQGIVTGVVGGVCFGSLFAVVGQWFKERRGTALAFMCMGCPIGAILFPVFTRQLIPKVGFPWTMRILGFIILFLVGISNLTLRRRLPPKDVAGSLFDPKALTSPAFTIYCIATFVLHIGLNTLPTFVASSAVSAGIAPQFSFYFISIMNCGSFLARIATALFVDKIGPINIAFPMTLIAVATDFVWPHVRSEKSFIAVSAVYGYTSATWLSIIAMPVYNLGSIEDSGRQIGLMLTTASLGAAAGPPISGAIIRATGRYVAAGYFAGSVTLLSCCMTLAVRQLGLKKIVGKF